MADRRVGMHGNRRRARASTHGIRTRSPRRRDWETRAGICGRGLPERGLRGSDILSRGGDVLGERSDRTSEVRAVEAIARGQVAWVRTMSFDLVIFDCDGVLIDSEPIARSVLIQMLSRADLAMSASEAIEIFGGRSAVNCLALMEERRGRPLPSGFLADWNRVLYDALARDVRPIAGVVAAIDALQVPVCVASNSSHERMRVSLRA